jgi:ABC-type antimicrobial peptide transport system permease subunit
VTLESLSRRSLAQPAFGAAIAGALALLALALAAVGTYGIFACAVAQRTRELGIRLAIGAAPSEIARLVLAEGASVAGVGLSGGLSAAALVTSWVRSIVPGAAPYDLLTFGAAASVMFGAAIMACWIPARRAGRLDPSSVLRSE